MKPPSPSAPPIELVRRLARTWEAVQPLIARSLAAEGLGEILQPGMGLVLFALFAEDGQRIGDIARRGCVSHVAILSLVRRLEQAGLVRRADCPDDGRATRVWLTPKGRAVERPMKAAARRNLESLTRILGYADAVALNELLGRVLDGLGAENEREASALSRQLPRARSLPKPASRRPSTPQLNRSS